MFPLFESICISEGRALHLDYHQRRYDRSCYRLYGAPTGLKLSTHIVPPLEFRTGKVKLRLCYNDKEFDPSYHHYRPRLIKTLCLVIHDQIDYSLKYTDRSAIESLMEQKGQADDILIVKNGRITESSFSNVIFYNGKEWLTPATPLLKGTCRERLLDEGRIKEADIYPEDLSGFTACRLINAMLDMDSAPIHIEDILGP